MSVALFLVVYYILEGICGPISHNIMSAFVLVS